MRNVAFDEVLSGYRRTHGALLDVSRKTDAPGRSAGSRVIYYWEHVARHLGMVEALRGVLGESGSARG